MSVLVTISPEGRGDFERRLAKGFETYMLVDKQYSNVLSILREAVECALNCALLGFLVHDKEVLLRVRWVCYVLQSYEMTFLFIEDWSSVRLRRRVECRSLCPITCLLMLPSKTSGVLHGGSAYTSSPITARNSRSL